MSWTTFYKQLCSRRLVGTNQPDQAYRHIITDSGFILDDREGRRRVVQILLLPTDDLKLKIDTFESKNIVDYQCSILR